MKIGVNRWTMPGDWSFERCLKAAKEAGFDSIEFNMAEDGVLGFEAKEPEVRALAETAQRIGVELSSLSTGLGWRYPLTSPDPAVREKGMQAIRKQLQIASWLGVDAILVVPGLVNEETAYDEAYERAHKALRELLPDAERLGVRIGVENVWNKFLLSPLEMRQFVDELGSPYAGVYFDAGNVLVMGYPEQWIRILGKRIIRVHVKDFKTHIGNISGFCNPLQGNVPWAKVNDALKQVGYDGYITAEVEGYPNYPELGLKHIAESLKAVFK